MMPLQLFTGLVILVLVCADRSIAATGGDGGQYQFIYNGFKGANLTLVGAAALTPNGLLTLTKVMNATSQTKGQAFHPSPVPLWDGAAGAGAVRSFSTAFVFAIFGQFTDVSSHGLTFFVTSNMAALSAAMPSQFLGLLNETDNGNRSARTFAVELDTILNAEFRDMNSNHVGIDINSLVSAEAADAGYYDDGTGEFRNLSLISRKAMQVWVDYDSGATQITVTMAPLGMARPKRPLLRTVVDLSGVVQEQEAGRSTAYVGFTSSTNGLFSHHYVVGWSFALDGPAPAIEISKLPALPRAGPRPRSRVLEIVLPIASAALVLAAGVAIYSEVRRRSKYAELCEEWEIPFGAHRFSYKDLARATDGFCDKRILGAGGFGTVYRGVLRNRKSKSSGSGAGGMEIAVKKVSHESRQGMREFVAEVVSIGRLQHRNLVQLLGYCRRRGELLLVYDYMPNGSLDRYLFDPNKGTLDWAQRFHVIRGVASGLLYLHEEWEQVVVHRDIKASNVLLDSNMNGRLGDFGLSRLYDHGADAHTTHVVGTMGYLAPELGHTGKATTATDVFAFGAFLLEVTCGRRPVVEENNRAMFIDHVTEQWRNGLIMNTIDTRMPNGYNPDEVLLVLKLALLCSHPFAHMRPTMRQVTQYLDGDLPLPELLLTNLSFNMLYRIHSSEFSQNLTPYSYVSSTSFGAISDLSSGGR